MGECLKTILMLNVQGSVLALLLILLRKMLRKSFSGRTQRMIWLLAAIMYLIPMWKFVPVDVPAPVIFQYSDDTSSEESDITELEAIIKGDIVQPEMEKRIQLSAVYLMGLIWSLGSYIFVILNIGSYVLFLRGKKRSSNNITDELFSDVLSELKIRRSIGVRRCADDDAPMLTGVFFPVVYIPERGFTNEELARIYCHELIHYKHKDLLLKWFVSFINALNWFNPLMYAVTKNLNEACEFYCDETVTESMNDEEKKLYMNTILNLALKE